MPLPYTDLKVGTNVCVTFNSITTVDFYNTLQDAERGTYDEEIYAEHEELIGEIFQNDPKSDWMLIQVGDGSLASVYRAEASAVTIKETDRLV